MTKSSPPSSFMSHLKHRHSGGIKHICIGGLREQTHTVLHKSPYFLKPKSIQMENEERLCQLQFLQAVDSLQCQYRTPYGHQE